MMNNRNIYDADIIKEGLTEDEEDIQGIKHILSLIPRRVEMGLMQ